MDKLCSFLFTSTAAGKLKTEGKCREMSEMFPPRGVCVCVHVYAKATAVASNIKESAAAASVDGS